LFSCSNQDDSSGLSFKFDKTASASGYTGGGSGCPEGCDWCHGYIDCPNGWLGDGECDCECLNYTDTDCAIADEDRPEPCDWHHNFAVCSEGWIGDGECDCECANFEDTLDCAGMDPLLEDDSFEPNNTREQARWVEAMWSDGSDPQSPDGLYTNLVLNPGDQDWFSVDYQAFETIFVEILYDLPYDAAEPGLEIMLPGENSGWTGYGRNHKVAEMHRDANGPVSIVVSGAVHQPVHYSLFVNRTMNPQPLRGSGFCGFESDIDRAPHTDVGDLCGDRESGMFCERVHHLESVRGKGSMRIDVRLKECSRCTSDLNLTARLDYSSSTDYDIFLYKDGELVSGALVTDHSGYDFIHNEYARFTVADQAGEDDSIDLSIEVRFRNAEWPLDCDREWELQLFGGNFANWP
jgi:hypothetical protein